MERVRNGACGQVHQSDDGTSEITTIPQRLKPPARPVAAAENIDGYTKRDATADPPPVRAAGRQCPSTLIRARSTSA
jgi:hypothetical protein